jgi:hypothetical protein
MNLSTTAITVPLPSDFVSLSIKSIVMIYLSLKLYCLSFRANDVVMSLQRFQQNYFI